MRCHADGQKLALVVGDAIDRKAPAAQPVEPGKPAIVDAGDDPEGAGHRQQVGKVGAAPRLVEAAPMQAGEPAQVERADIADGDGARSEAADHGAASAARSGLPAASCASAGRR
jgi:hypothetical protein